MTAELNARLAELNAEIRHYPGPIASSDLHLPALLEERAALLARVRRLEEQGSCPPEAVWANDGGCAA
ncbi:MAG: hypothetical protein FJY43_04630 [Betaproteobacteria bacterium]|nr:hypothetical protein [Betaproteobacteria bacterium]